jgi:REP element-mobilizing transposase RayT
MAEPYVQVYVHIVWATWDRLPLIGPDLLPRVRKAIAEKCRELGCAPIEIGGTLDHTHGFP